MPRLLSRASRALPLVSALPLSLIRSPSCGSRRSARWDSVHEGAASQAEGAGRGARRTRTPRASASSPAWRDASSAPGGRSAAGSARVGCVDPPPGHGRGDPGTSDGGPRAGGKPKLIPASRPPVSTTTARDGAGSRTGTDGARSGALTGAGAAGAGATLRSSTVPSGTTGSGTSGSSGSVASGGEISGTSGSGPTVPVTLSRVDPRDVRRGRGAGDVRRRHGDGRQGRGHLGGSHRRDRRRGRGKRERRGRARHRRQCRLGEAGRRRRRRRARGEAGPAAAQRGPSAPPADRWFVPARPARARPAPGAPRRRPPA